MESQQVVLIEARARDRRSMVETTMRAMPVVVVKPGGQARIAQFRVFVVKGIDPFAESSLDKALGLAIGARGVGTGKAMLEAEFETGAAEQVGAVAMTVIGEQASNGDAQSSVISQCRAQKGHGTSGSEVGQHLGESDAGVVIDGDVKIFPTAVMFAATAPVRSSLDLGKTAELFDIQVEQVSRSGMFIAQDGHGGFQVRDAIQAEAAENAAHGGPAQPCGLGDMPACPALPAQLRDLLDEDGLGAPWRSVRTRRAVVQTRQASFTIAAGPLGRGAGTDFEVGGVK